MKKINLKGLIETLSEKELKGVMAGSGGNSNPCSEDDCKRTIACTNSAGQGHCKYLPLGGCNCLANG